MISINQIIGANIRKYREALGLSREKMATKLDITSSTLYNLETGSRGTTFERLEEIARVLGVPMHELLTPPDDAKVPATYWMDKFPPDIREWLLKDPNAIQWVTLGQAWINKKDTLEVIEGVTKFLRQAKTDNDLSNE